VNKLLIKNQSANTPLPSQSWRELPETSRVALICRIISEKALFADIEVSSANIDGHINITLKSMLSPHLRGELLLDFEEVIKNTVDPGLTVWCNPIGDKSSLRRLRGIEIKS